MSLHTSNRGQMFNKWIGFVVWVGGGGGVWSDPRSQRDYTSGQHGSTKRQRSRARYTRHNMTIQGGRTTGVCDRADGGEMRLVPARSACLRVSSTSDVRALCPVGSRRIRSARRAECMESVAGAGVTGCFKAILEKRFYTMTLFSWYVLAVTQLQLNRCPLSCEIEKLAKRTIHWGQLILSWFYLVFITTWLSQEK